LLLPLVVSAFVRAYIWCVPQRSVESLSAAIKRHEVAFIQVHGSGRHATAVWATHWYEWATTKASDTMSGKVPDLGEISTGADGDYFNPWGLHNLLGYGRGIVMFCTLAAFLVMLANGGGLIGNRWFWFWLGLGDHGVGAVSPILYLMVERVPIWVRGPRLLPDKPPLGGFSGCFLTIPLMILIALILALLQWVLAGLYG
jgi:hypothetical protein